MKISVEKVVETTNQEMCNVKLIKRNAGVWQMVEWASSVRLHIDDIYEKFRQSELINNVENFSICSRRLKNF
jgi:hypothetical protein